MTAKLTPEACRAGRALLNWSVRDLMREAGVSPNTVTGLERGDPVRPITEAKIVECFERFGVEITNGDGTGAQLRRLGKGEWVVLPLKAGPGYIARFTPSGYGPTKDGPICEAEADAWAWIKSQGGPEAPA
jgi:transcriptional regulator with XRE-family HTH domain